MIDFECFCANQKEPYRQLLMTSPRQGCEYSPANLCMWGRQQGAFIEGCCVLFSHFNGRSVYPYPVGSGNRRGALEAILADAKERGIPCRISNMNPQDVEELESWFPGKFHIRMDRDSFDYVYDIQDLAELKGRKFQKKRNHLNRFRAEHSQAQAVVLTKERLPQAQAMVEAWYEKRKKDQPELDFTLESVALGRAFRHYEQLELEGMVLLEGEQVLAVTMGSRLSPDTYDIHFEKAITDGAYAAINQAFAQHLRQQHPQLQYLNREDDLGLEGLRQAKLSYNPHHMVEKYWACLEEELNRGN